jgi:hypothetical protein
VRRHVRDAFAVDVDLALVAQTLDILFAGERPPLAGDNVFGLIAFLRVSALRPAFARNMPLRRANAKASFWGSPGLSGADRRRAVAAPTAPC